MQYTEFATALADLAVLEPATPFTCRADGAVLEAPIRRELGALLANSKLEMIVPAVDSEGMHHTRRPGKPVSRSAGDIRAILDDAGGGYSTKAVCITPNTYALS